MMVAAVSNVGGRGHPCGVSDDSLPRFAGVMTTRELLSRGVSAERIRTLVRRGLLVPAGRGTYARAALLRTGRGGEHALRVTSVLALAGPGAAGSHQSAAIIHGLDQLGPRSAALVAVTHTPGAGSGTGRPGVRVHVAALPEEHVTVRGGVRVTSVARTVVDLARVSSFRSGVVVADSALRGKLTTKDELRAVLAACASWPGIRQARLVVEFSDALSESALESISRVAFRDHDLPAPELQAWVGGDGVIGRADFLWRRYATVGEADGAVKYASPGQAISQLRRDASLRAAGFQVVHFTWDEIVRVPGQVAASIRAAFQRGAAA
jgi:Transcriptional regulator, AbiEi antitoxin